MAQFIDSIIIGGGQAGLSMSQCLTQYSVEHLVIERGRVGERWRSERWPSLRLLTPSWMTRLPSANLAGADEGFLTTQDLVARLEAYATSQRVPLLENTEVISVDLVADLYRVVTSGGTWIARALVVATGACDQPNVPAWAQEISSTIEQMTPNQYQTPDTIALGGVLVVGASATGAQLASEIARSGRKTMIAVGSHVRSPRQYRGRDIFEWLDASGFLAEAPPANRSTAELASQPSMQLVGTQAGSEIDIHSLAKLGVQPVGRVTQASGSQISLANNLINECEIAESRRHGLLRRVDAFIAQTGISAPEDPQVWTAPDIPSDGPATLDLKAEGIGTVLWATGFHRHYPWLDLPAFDSSGEIRHCGGISDLPGLYVLGLPSMRHRASTFIDGVGRDAEALAPVVAAQLNQQSFRAA